MTTTTKARKILQATQKMTPQEREKILRITQEKYLRQITESNRQMNVLYHKLQTITTHAYQTGLIHY